MDTSYVQTFGSFFRNGKYPLEANYIFNSEQELKQWEENNKKYLHEGLLKVVVTEDLQTLYWYHNDTFKPLLTSESLENITSLLQDFELHGQLRDLLKDIDNNYELKWKAFQQELDLIQVGVGLNGDGTFDKTNMQSTYYLKDVSSVIEALKVLDVIVSGSGIDEWYWEE